MKQNCAVNLWTKDIWSIGNIVSNFLPLDIQGVFIWSLSFNVGFDFHKLNGSINMVCIYEVGISWSAKLNSFECSKSRIY